MIEGDLDYECARRSPGFGARAVSDEDLSLEICKTVAELLKNPAS